MKSIQKGMTLIEMVIAISLLAIMIAAVVFSFDGSKSRAQVLVSAMTEYAGALERMKTDTACYPTSLVALFDRAKTTATTDSHCGSVLANQWNGPYVKPATTDSTGRKIAVGQISTDVVLSLERADSVFGGAGGKTSSKWFIVADGVPPEISIQAEIACNGLDANGAIVGIPKCARSGPQGISISAWATPSIGGGANVPVSTIVGAEQFYMLFNETRK